MNEERFWLLMPQTEASAAWVDRAREMLLVPLLPAEAASVLDAFHGGASRLNESARESSGATEEKSAKNPEDATDRRWDSLTGSERTVVLLAAEGLTNPEIGRQLFISPRTVSTHLKHAFVKLGVTSRVELAALVVRRER